MIRVLPEDFPSVRLAVIDTDRRVDQLQEHVVQLQAALNRLADKVVVQGQRIAELERAPRRKWWQR